MSAIGLFGEPEHVPVEQPPEGLGQDARKTWRRMRRIEAGLHPAAKFHLHPGVISVDIEGKTVTGLTCGRCAGLWSKQASGNAYSKCDLFAGDSLDGPDMRKWWPACTAYRPAPEGKAQ